MGSVDESTKSQPPASIVLPPDRLLTGARFTFPCSNAVVSSLCLSLFPLSLPASTSCIMRQVLHTLINLGRVPSMASLQVLSVTQLLCVSAAPSRATHPISNEGPLSSSLSWAHQHQCYPLCATTAGCLVCSVTGAGAGEARDQAIADSTHERPVVRLSKRHRHSTTLTAASILPGLIQGMHSPEHALERFRLHRMPIARTAGERCSSAPLCLPPVSGSRLLVTGFSHALMLATR